MKYFVSFTAMMHGKQWFGNHVIDIVSIKGLEDIRNIEDSLKHLKIGPGERCLEPVIISFQKLGLSENEVRLPRRTK